MDETVLYTRLYKKQTSTRMCNITSERIFSATSGESAKQEETSKREGRASRNRRDTLMNGASYGPRVGIVSIRRDPPRLTAGASGLIPSAAVRRW